MMTATRSMGGVVGSATPAASAWVKSADPWPTRISVLHPALAERELSICAVPGGGVLRAGSPRPSMGHGHPVARSPIRLRFLLLSPIASWLAQTRNQSLGATAGPRACCWAAERDPNWPFGPEAVSPAASPASVVYWAPRSLPKPNPPFSRFRGAVHLAAPGPKRLAALASALARSKAASHLRPASPVPDCGEKFTAHPGDVNPEIVTIRTHCHAKSP